MIRHVSFGYLISWWALVKRGTAIYFCYDWGTSTNPRWEPTSYAKFCEDQPQLRQIMSPINETNIAVYNNQFTMLPFQRQLLQIVAVLSVQRHYWSSPPFLIFDIQSLGRSVLSARAPECQKLKIKMVGYTSTAKYKALTGSAVTYAPAKG